MGTERGYNFVAVSILKCTFYITIEGLASYRFATVNLKSIYAYACFNAILQSVHLFPNVCLGAIFLRFVFLYPLMSLSPVRSVLQCSVNEADPGGTFHPVGDVYREFN